LINRFKGLDYGGTIHSSSIYTNGLSVFYQYEYSVYKKKLYGFALQAGGEIKYKLSSASAFVLNLAYNHGFVNINEVNIQSFIGNDLNDRGKVFYRGTGLSLTLGYMFYPGQLKRINTFVLL